MEITDDQLPIVLNVSEAAAIVIALDFYRSMMNKQPLNSLFVQHVENQQLTERGHHELEALMCTLADFVTGYVQQKN